MENSLINTKNKLVRFLSELRYGEVTVPELVRVDLREMVTLEDDNRFLEPGRKGPVSALAGAGGQHRQSMGPGLSVDAGRRDVLGAPAQVEGRPLAPVPPARGPLPRPVPPPPAGGVPGGVLRHHVLDDGPAS